MSSLFFPRGNGPLISVLIPTRGRTELLSQSISKTHENITDKSLVEYLVKCDVDDETSIEIAKKLKDSFPVRVIVSPRGNGYRDLDRYINELSAASNADWLFLFNDDAFVSTPGWDQIILNASAYDGWIGIQDCCLLTFGQSKCYGFPLIRRKVYQLLGCYSRSPLCDTWIFSLMFSLEATINIASIEIKHERNLMIDPIRRDLLDNKEDLWQTIKSPLAIRKRMDDARVLLRHMELLRESMEWKKEPEKTGWYWWRLTESHPEQSLLVFKDFGKFNVEINGAEAIINGGNVAIGPVFSRFCDQSMVYNISELGGEWSSF